MQELTPKEQQVVDAIIDYYFRHGYSPSMKELLVSTEMSSIASIFKYVRMLQAKGVIKLNEKEPRTFQISGYGYVDNRTDNDKQVPIRTYARTLTVISDFLLSNGYAPSVRDLCKATGLKSTSTIYHHLDYLQSMQKINLRGNNCPRAMTVKGIVFQRLEE